MVRLITLNGETHSVTGWERRVGTSRNAIGQRLRRGWTEFDAVFTPETKSKGLFMVRAESIEPCDGFTVLDYIFKRNEGSASIAELMDYFALSLEQCRDIYDRVYNLDIDDIGRII